MFVVLIEREARKSDESADFQKKENPDTPLGVILVPNEHPQGEAKDKNDEIAKEGYSKSRRAYPEAAVVLFLANHTMRSEYPD